MTSTGSAGRLLGAVALVAVGLAPILATAQGQNVSIVLATCDDGTPARLFSLVLRLQAPGWSFRAVPCDKIRTLARQPTVIVSDLRSLAKVDVATSLALLGFRALDPRTTDRPVLLLQRRGQRGSPAKVGMVGAPFPSRAVETWLSRVLPLATKFVVSYPSGTDLANALLRDKSDKSIDLAAIVYESPDPILPEFLDVAAQRDAAAFEYAPIASFTDSHGVLSHGDLSLGVLPVEGFIGPNRADPLARVLTTAFEARTGAAREVVALAVSQQDLPVVYTNVAPPESVEARLLSRISSQAYTLALAGEGAAGSPCRDVSASIDRLVLGEAFLRGTASLFAYAALVEQNDILGTSPQNANWSSLEGRLIEALQTSAPVSGPKVQPALARALQPIAGGNQCPISTRSWFSFRGRSLEQSMPYESKAADLLQEFYKDPLPSSGPELETLLEARHDKLGQAAACLVLALNSTPRAQCDVDVSGLWKGAYVPALYAAVAAALHK
jgi:hypothetical protein